MTSPPVRFLLLGRPVAASLSPVMHNAALAAAGIAGRYAVREVGPEDLAAELTAAVGQGCRGFNITVPLKVSAMGHCARIGPEAVLAGAVNTMVVEGASLVGHNTDVGALRELIGRWATRNGARPGFRAVILGAGGAARAAAVAAVLAGAGRVVIAARDPARARAVADDLSARLQSGAPGVAQRGRLAGTPLDQVLAGAGWEAEVVVQATSAPDGHLTPWPGWPAGSLAIELNYRPWRTAFLGRALGAGAEAVGGIEVLLGQGELAFELLTGRPAPPGIMRQALMEEVAARC